MKAYAASMEAWEATKGGLKEAIRQAAKKDKGEVPQDLKMKLGELEANKPVKPKVPRLLYDDVTTEELRFSLATGWPSGGQISSEAGIIFGSHSMGNDSIVRNLATLNALWDGADIATDRRTSESFLVRGARLTIALMVQEKVLDSFFDGSETIARGSGFLARFLIAVPESTQGTRLHTPAPPWWPHLNAFNIRIASFLDIPVPFDENGELHPVMLEFSPEAKAAWIAFHDQVEVELGNGGKFRDVRDVASKVADNASRLAALFHVFENGIGGAVGISSFNSASKIMEWHLNEARRFFGDRALPEELADAGHLDAWLLDRCLKQGPGKNEVHIQDVQQCGPNRLRKKEKTDAAMVKLEELGRAMRFSIGQKKFIAVNPDLLKHKHTATAISATPAIPPPLVAPWDVPVTPAQFQTPAAESHDADSVNSSNSSSKPNPPKVTNPVSWDDFNQGILDGTL
jgi:putative DNA primase/helicase